MVETRLVPFLVLCFVEVTNCEFVCGKAEDIMPDLQKNVKFWEESVGVVDPPRAGLHEIAALFLSWPLFVTSYLSVSLPPPSIFSLSLSLSLMLM